MNNIRYLRSFLAFAPLTLIPLTLAPLACGAAAVAEPPYPVKPVRLLVGFVAGGSADGSARVIAGRMNQALGGANFVIENRGGAGGSVAANIVAKAPADGYTLLWSSPGALTISQIIEKDLPYNTEKAFAPIGLALTYCNALISRPDFAAATVQQLIALAKEKPGSINYGTQGVGSAGHLSAEMLRKMTGIQLTQVPYKGGAEILTALLANELQLAFASSTTAQGMRSRIRVIAVTSVKRDPALPDVPSLSEAGVKGYDASFWFGLLAPAGTPPAIVNRLNRAMREALTDPQIVQPVQNQGLNPEPSSPQEYAARIKADYVKWKAVIGGG